MQKIYVDFIDGTKYLVPVNAEEIGPEMYLILDDEEYKNKDSSELFEFYPGDIVEAEDTDDLDLEYQHVAVSLISAGENSLERRYLRFKFYSTQRLMTVSKETAEEYKEVIERIVDEKRKGLFFYKGITETVEFLYGFVKK